ncbi:MAG: condensation domain-containing protein [Phycisphaerae bacterium]
MLHTAAGRCRLRRTPLLVGGKGPQVVSIATTHAVPDSKLDLDSSPARAFRQPLNAADRLMLVAHNGMRRLGHCGFLCQTHVWLKGRLDLDALRRAVAKLHQDYPILSARLVTPGDKSAPYWQSESRSEVDLREATLDGSDNAAVWHYAENLFTEPLDLHQQAPIAFHLLHWPDARDVLIVRFSHALMDGKAPEFMLSELNRRHESARTSPLTDQLKSCTTGSDEMADYLDRFDRRHRLRAALRVVGSHIKLPVRSATLAQQDEPSWITEPTRILVRTLDTDQTAALTERVKRLCGFANLAPAVLAGIFRAIHFLTPHKEHRRSGFKTDVPLNLRPPGIAEPIFRNFMSFIQMSAMEAEMGDRDQLTRTLNAKMRDQLRRGIDLGNLQMMAIMARHEKLLARHLLERMRKDPIALGFGFLGPVIPGLETFLDQEVEWLYTLNSALSPPGVVLQVNQFRGRMNLILTYISEAVPEPLAESFLDTIMEDLLA